jgi:hypothetical protein
VYDSDPYTLFYQNTKLVDEDTADE